MLDVYNIIADTGVSATGILAGADPQHKGKEKKNIFNHTQYTRE
jgi:hypothetical protein